MPRRSSLVLVTVLGATVSAQTYHDNSPDCQCYLTGGKTPGYYMNYRFFDFRNMPASTVGKPDISRLGLGSNDNSVSNPYFSSPTWDNDWDIQSWMKNPTSDFPIKVDNSPLNIFIDKADNLTNLNLRAVRFPGYTSTAEVETAVQNIQFASIRMKARVIGSPGACAAIFTYKDDNNEADIEILTKDRTSQIHYTNQPSVDDEGDDIPGASTQLTLPGTWNTWAVHRLDWLPTMSSWYFNNIWQLNKTLQVPKTPSAILLNMWSNGGEWTGAMPIGGVATLQIQWIEMAFNVSSYNPKGRTCRTVCAIDGVRQTGFPEIVATSLGTAKRAVSVVKEGGSIGLLPVAIFVGLSPVFLPYAFRAVSGRKSQ